MELMEQMSDHRFQIRRNLRDGGRQERNKSEKRDVVEAATCINRSHRRQVSCLWYQNEGKLNPDLDSTVCRLKRYLTKGRKR